MKLEKLKVYPSAGFLLPLPETGMWDYAIKNGHIKDIDKYLTSITERQDFSLNMSKMSEEELQKETTEWLKRLNKLFGTGLGDKNLLKTGGEDEHSAHQPKKEDKNQTTHDTLNYGTQAGTMR